MHLRTPSFFSGSSVTLAFHVGSAGLGTFIACAPIPGYDQGGDGGGDDDSSSSRVPTIPSTPIQPSYMAAVTHIDTSSYWVSRAHWTADSANKRALAACKAAMGDGCVLNETVYGYGPFGVMIDAMGLRWIKSGADVPKGTPESIRYQALAMLCVKKFVRLRVRRSYMARRHTRRCRAADQFRHR